jgi:hypothetical protein
MADSSTLQTLLMGAIGGLLPLALKYVVDRFAERYRSDLRVAARRKEQLYTKQAKVVIGVYSRLADSMGDVYDLLGVSSRRWGSVYTFKGGVKKQISPESCHRSFDKFQHYFIKYKPYLPPLLANDVTGTGLRLFDTIKMCEKNAKAASEGSTQETLSDSESLRGQVRRTMKDLTSKFRELMNGEGDQSRGQMASSCDFPQTDQSLEERRLHSVDSGVAGTTDS